MPAAAQHDDSSIQDQPAPSFTADQYAKLIALLHKHDLEITPTTSRESTGAAMLAGKILCFSTSKPDLKWIIDSRGAQSRLTENRLTIFSVREKFELEPN